MKIFFTGVAGFIGNKTAYMLLEQGHEVIGVDNLNDYYDVRLKNYRLNLLKKFSNFKFYELDIEKIDLLDDILKKINLML